MDWEKLGRPIQLCNSAKIQEKMQPTTHIVKQNRKSSESAGFSIALKPFPTITSSAKSVSFLPQGRHFFLILIMAMEIEKQGE